MIISSHLSAPAKINLALHITGKREDGYHLLDSLVVFADVGDALSVRAGEGLRLTITGAYAEALSDGDNLVLRAARVLAAFVGIEANAHITLEKRLPVGSGIGGGSADAAAALHLLNHLWGLGHDTATLAKIGLTLGADVPVCIHRQSCRMQGVGEVITPLSFLGGLSLVLLTPPVSLSTAKVFAAYPPNSFSAALQIPKEGESWIDALHEMQNDLQIPAIECCPDIAPRLEAIAQSEGCLLARMSGSGATCFGLYADTHAAQKAQSVLQAMFPEDWCVTTAIA